MAEIDDLRVAVAELKITCQNQEKKLGEHDIEQAEMQAKLDIVTNKFDMLMSNLSLGWKMVIGIGSFTGGLTVILYNLKYLLGWGK